MSPTRGRCTKTLGVRGKSGMQHGYTTVLVAAVCAALVAVLCAGCGRSGPAAKPTATARPADPAGIDRIRTRLPADYEIAPLPAPPMPATFWGVAPGWSSDPPDCGALADVGAGARGWSASGPGGIVYALVATGVEPAAEQRRQCAVWTLGGRSTGAIAVADGPLIPDVPTMSLTADITTRVENGTETHSHARTLLAYVEALAISVTVVTDPGSGAPDLPESLPAELLGAAVQAIRSTNGATR